MATIKASGDTFIGKRSVEVSGDKMVRRIKADNVVFEQYIRLAIKRRRGEMANAYRPPANSMLQAYALIADLFGANNVTVDGDIGEIECESGRIY